MKTFLTMMVIMELIFDDGRVVDTAMRLIGSEVEHFYGNMTGRKISEHPEKNGVARVLKGINRIMEIRAPIVTLASGQLAGHRHLSVNTAYVPMAEDGENIDKIVGYVEISSLPEANS